MTSNHCRGSISVLVMIKGSSQQRVTGTQPQRKPAETPPRSRLPSSSPLPSWHFWSFIQGRLPSLSASQSDAGYITHAHTDTLNTLHRLRSPLGSRSSCRGASPALWWTRTCSALGWSGSTVSWQPVPAAWHLNVTIVMSSGHCHLSLFN